MFEATESQSNFSITSPYFNRNASKNGFEDDHKADSSLVFGQSDSKFLSNIEEINSSLSKTVDTKEMEESNSIIAHSNYNEKIALLISQAKEILSEF